MASSQEEEQIKSIFQFTLESSESPKLFYLSNLAQRLKSVNQTISAFGNSNANASTACQICGKLWPNDQVVFHRAICSLLTPEQRLTSVVRISQKQYNPFHIH
jgi:hypothetical protein